MKTVQSFFPTTTKSKASFKHDHVYKVMKKASLDNTDSKNFQNAKEGLEGSYADSNNSKRFSKLSPSENQAQSNIFQNCKYNKSLDEKVSRPIGGVELFRKMEMKNQLNHNSNLFNESSKALSKKGSRRFINMKESRDKQNALRSNWHVDFNASQVVNSNLQISVGPNRKTQKSLKQSSFQQRQKEEQQLNEKFNNEVFKEHLDTNSKYTRTLTKHNQSVYQVQYSSNIENNEKGTDMVGQFGAIIPNDHENIQKGGTNQAMKRCSTAKEPTRSKTLPKSTFCKRQADENVRPNTMNAYIGSQQAGNFEPGIGTPQERHPLTSFTYGHRSNSSVVRSGEQSKHKNTNSSFSKQTYNKKNKLKQQQSWASKQSHHYLNKMALLNEINYKKPLVEKMGNQYFECLLRNRYQEEPVCTNKSPFIYQLFEDEEQDVNKHDGKAEFQQSERNLYEKGYRTGKSFKIGQGNSDTTTKFINKLKSTYKPILLHRNRMAVKGKNKATKDYQKQREKEQKIHQEMLNNQYCDLLDGQVEELDESFQEMM